MKPRKIKGESMNTRHTGRIVGALLTLMPLLLIASPAVAETTTISLADLVFRGGAGESRAYTWETPSWAVGQDCTVTVVNQNGQSDHNGNTLDVGPLRAVEIENAPFATTTVSGSFVQAETGSAVITLSSNPDDAWRPATDSRPAVFVYSGSLEVTITCDTGTTTTSAPSSTTTSSEQTTTTTTVVTTTTSQPPSSSTTDPSTSTSTSVPDTTPPRATVNCSDDRIVVTGLWQGEWGVSDNRDHVWEFRVDDPAKVYTFALIDNPIRVSLIGELNGERYIQTVAIDCEGPVTTTPSTVPPTTVPPITGSTLPFTGPEDMGGWAMAGGALFLLGSAMVLGLRQREGVHTQ